MKKVYHHCTAIKHARDRLNYWREEYMDSRAELSRIGKLPAGDHKAVMTRLALRRLNYCRASLRRWVNTLHGILNSQYPVNV